MNKINKKKYKTDKKETIFYIKVPKMFYNDNIFKIYFQKMYHYGFIFYKKSIYFECVFLFSGLFYVTTKGF